VTCHQPTFFYLSTSTYERIWRYGTLPFVSSSTEVWIWEYVSSLNGTYSANIDGPPTAMDYDSLGSLWIGTAVAVDVWWDNLTLSRFGGLEGLPFANITSVITSDTEIWFGTASGVVRRDSEGEWWYYFGSRWHPGTSVLSIGLRGSISSGILEAFIATDEGLAIIQIDFNYTLAQKAEWYQSLIEPYFNRYGLVADVGLLEFGNPDLRYPVAGESDGIWSGIYLASQCFRYAVTKDPVVKEQAWKHFEAFEFLLNVTGIPGFVARSFAPLNDTYRQVTE
jgi:hypothetical protein